MLYSRLIGIVIYLSLVNRAESQVFIKCCMAHVRLAELEYASLTDVTSCVDRCVTLSKVPAVGNITYRIVGSSIEQNYQCYCIPVERPCLDLPASYCFSRFDSSDPSLPTGGIPTAFALYSRCKKTYWGLNCQKACFCDSFCSTVDGVCLGTDCMPNTDRTDLPNGMFVCNARNCTELSGGCETACEFGSDTSFLECSCDYYQYYDNDLNECMLADHCDFHGCPVCAVVEGSKICDCTDQYGKITLMIYGTPVCVDVLGPCLNFTCTDAFKVCHESPKGQAVCHCPDGQLPNENGECFREAALPNVKHCHGYFNQGFYYTCLCHSGYVAKMDRCILESISDYRSDICEHLDRTTDYHFCVCRSRCDFMTICGSEDGCPPDQIPPGCNACTKALNHLAINGTFGGLFLVPRLNELYTFSVLGPSDLADDAQFSLGYIRDVPTYSSFRDLKFTPDGTANETDTTYYAIARAKINAVDYESYPIFFTSVPPLRYEYRFADGVVTTLDEGFGTYRISIIWPGSTTMTYLWYCSRIPGKDFRIISNKYPCCVNNEVFFRKDLMNYDVDETKLDMNSSSSYNLYYIYAVPIVDANYPELVKRLTVRKLMNNNDFRITCRLNCAPGTPLSRTTGFILELTTIRGSNWDLIYTWMLPLSELERDIGTRGQTVDLTPAQVRRLPDGNHTFKCRIYDRIKRMSNQYEYSVSVERVQRKNCSIDPLVGYGMITKFTVTCTGGFRIKILSGLCGKRRDVTLLKYVGSSDEPITNLIFSIGDPHDHFRRCVYIPDTAMIDDEEFIKFKVLRNITYVSNFQFLGHLRMDSLSAIIVLGNAIEFFNDSPATDDLDKNFRVKCRELLLELIMRNWNTLDDQQLEMETIKLMYLLLSNPTEIDPYHVVTNMYLYEMIDAAKLWSTDDFSLTEDDFYKSLDYLTECLSFILYSAYLRYNASHGVKGKNVLLYILDNLAYMGDFYITHLDADEPVKVATSVFTLYLKKFTLNFEVGHLVDDDLPGFTIQFPKEMADNFSTTNVSMKLVLFPFNPLAMNTARLFTPTVSVSLYSEGNYLPIKNMLNPVKIKIPISSSEWLTYKNIECDSSSMVFMGLPSTMFNNTLYKLKITAEFDKIYMSVNRVEGVLIMVLCDGSAREIRERVAKKSYKNCFEIYFRRVNFYKSVRMTFSITLPQILTHDVQSGLVYYFVTKTTIKLTLSFSIIQFSCQYWYEPDEQSTYGCAVSPTETEENFLVCLCYHLSYFTGGSHVGTQEAIIESVSVGSTTDEELGSLTVVTVFVVWIFYFFFGMWARKMDLKYAIFAYPVDLADNYPNGEYVYLVCVETGLRPNSGCGGTVFLSLTGTLNKSLPHKLVCKKYKTLQTGHQNYFIIRTKEPLGKIILIRLWIVDETESGKKINWYLNQVTVFDLQFRDAYVFICEEWMGVNAKGMGNDMTFFAATSIMLNEFNNIFTMNFFKGILENHVWISIFTNPILSRFTRFQRVASCMLNTMLYLLTTLLLQRIEASKARSGTIFYTIFKDVTLTILIGFLISPIFWFFDVLFSQSRKKDATHNIISDWNRHIGMKKKVEHEGEEQNTFITYLLACLNFFSRLFKGSGRLDIDFADMDFYGHDVRNMTRRQLVTHADNRSMNNPGTKSETKKRKISGPSLGSSIGSLRSSDAKSEKGAKVDTGTEERARMLMKLLIEERGGKLKKKLTKQSRDNVDGSLPWWMNIVAWVALMTTNAITSVACFVYMSDNSNVLSFEWYVRIVITLIANILIIDPICIVAGAFCRSLVSRQYVTFPLVRLTAIKYEATENLIHYYDYHKKRVYKLRRSPYYRSPVMIKKKIKVEKKLLHSKLVLLNVFLFQYLWLCSLVFSINMHEYSIFLAKETIERVIIGGQIGNVRSRDEYYDWMLRELIPDLYDDRHNFENESKIFSRLSSLQQLPSIDGYAISYPCSTRVKDMNAWNTYLDDPEWFNMDTACMGYSSFLAKGSVKVMREVGFFNFNYYGMGTTFYLYSCSIQSIIWVFLTAFQPYGGGFRAQVDTIFVLPEKPLPSDRRRVLLSMTLFWPLFIFSLLRNIKKFFYLGAGRYLNNFWNILDLTMAFMVLMICILYAFVIHNINAVLQDFSLYTGEIYITFYLSGIRGFYFFIDIMTFIICIRTIEIAQLNHLQHIFQNCLIQNAKTFNVLMLKFLGVTMAIIYLKTHMLSPCFYKYGAIGHRVPYLVVDLVDRKNIFQIPSVNTHLVAVIAILMAIYGTMLRCFMMADAVFQYNKLREFQKRTKEWKNLMIYIKGVVYDFAKWYDKKVHRARRRWTLLMNKEEDE